jgi:Protein of unknown function (DUF3048) N-terminal domain/Protein of unknown function (DUF3048) C-terminal domain
MRITRSFVLLTVGALAIAACGGGGGDAEETTTVASTTTAPSTTVAETTTTAEVTTTTEAATTTTELPAVIRQPLTGQPLASADEIIPRPALVAKIDNVDARQNHTGLAVADIVYEEIVEGRATRFAAVFHSQSADPLGPIRSGRTQDVLLFSSYNSPLFVWSGGNPNVTRAIDESTLINMSPSHADGYFRGPGSKPHNLYNSTDAIWLQTPPDQPGPPGQNFQYLREGQTFTGDPSAGFAASVGSTQVDWQWNADTAKFERSQNGTPHVDKTYGQIAATNVVVMGVNYQPSAADSRSPEAQTIGEGPVFVFSDGKVIEGRWKRDFVFYPIQYFDLQGNEILLNPGNTWVELAEEVPTLDPAKTGVDMLIKPAAQ